ncbi:MAG: MazG nucleotide pyrophosphohydrolase domain-containing protein [Planctomycetota bacterium]
MSDFSGESTNESLARSVTIKDFQNLIREMYFEKDVSRGIPATFMWLMEEVGELSTALRETTAEEKQRITEAEFDGRRANLQAEFADVLAWLATIANVAEIDLSTAICAKYGSGCPGCSQFVCECPDEEKP